MAEDRIGFFEEVDHSRTLTKLEVQRMRSSPGVESLDWNGDDVDVVTLPREEPSDTPQCVSVETVVGIEKIDEGPPCQGKPGVAGSRWPAIGLAEHGEDLGSARPEALRYRCAAIGASVIDDNDLVCAAEALAKHAREGVTEIPFGIEDRHYDRELHR